MVTLKSVFTSIRQRNIFNICPFLIRRRKGALNFRIDHFNTARMFLRGKKTFGESENLRRLIRRTFTRADYELLRAGNKDVVVTVSNLSRYSVEYHSVHNNTYEDFCDWMWISANIVPFMSLVVKNGMEYGDGGFGNYLPLREAIRRGACEIDAVILKPQVPAMVHRPPVSNAFSLLFRTLEFMLEQISLDDLQMGHSESLRRKVLLQCYHTPHLLTDNSFLFDPEQMRIWWEEGIRHAASEGPACREIG